MCEDLGFDCRYQQPAAYPNMIIGKESVLFYSNCDVYAYSDTHQISLVD
jgi:hypothetical protein